MEANELRKNFKESARPISGGLLIRRLDRKIKEAKDDDKKEITLTIDDAIWIKLSLMYAYGTPKMMSRADVEYETLKKEMEEEVNKLLDEWRNS